MKLSRSSVVPERTDRKAELMERFGLTDVQAQAIVDMRLRALTGLEREKLEAEYDELMKKIEELQGDSCRQKASAWCN